MPVIENFPLDAAGNLKGRLQDTAASGNLTAQSGAGSTLLINTQGLAAVGVGITGTWVATLQFEGSVDGTNWFSVVGVPYGGGQGTTSVTANGNWRIHSAGLQQVRVRCSAFTSGTATVALEAANGPAAGGHNPTGANLTAPLLYNGATYDAWTNNQQGTLLASAARTATASSPVQTNVNAKGILLTLNVSAASGTGGLTPQIQATDPVSGTSNALWTAGVAVIATGVLQYFFYPAAIVSAFGPIKQSANLFVPRGWTISVLAGDTSSYTYSLGYCYLT